ncbi:unnamed protein product [Ceutorhynchus assimilis]|uniref:Uncharacterized protein n=1 Tax=Ceutorhynchus assimilis TaxID=467358 RepID=A0A9N9QJC1_9CUCU|nr:unnamed protein product [Ceutorhynchus assimilis]
MENARRLGKSFQVLATNKPIACLFQTFQEQGLLSCQSPKMNKRPRPNLGIAVPSVVESSSKASRK